MLADGEWEKIFKVKPEVFTRRRNGMAGSDAGRGPRIDAFFPFGDNIERAHKSGVKYVAEPADPSGTIM